MKLNFNRQQSSPNTQQNNNVDINKLSDRLSTLNPTNQIKLKFTSSKEYNLDQLINYKRRNNDTCPLIVHVRNNDNNDQKVIEHITKIILSDNGVVYNNSANPEDLDYYKNVVYKVPNFDTIFDEYFNRYYSYYYDKVTKAEVSGGTLMLDDILENISRIHDGLYDSLINNDSALTYAGDENEYNKPQIEFEYGTEASDDDQSSISNNTIFQLNFKVIKDNGKDILQMYYGEEPINGVDITDILSKQKIVVSKYMQLAKGDWDLNTRQITVICNEIVDRDAQIILTEPHKTCERLFKRFNIKYLSLDDNLITFTCDEIPDRNIYVKVVILNAAYQEDMVIPDNDMDYMNFILTDDSGNYLVDDEGQPTQLEIVPVFDNIEETGEDIDNIDIDTLVYTENNQLLEDELVRFVIEPVKDENDDLEEEPDE